MNKKYLAVVLLIVLTACSLSSLKPTTPMPTLLVVPSPTPIPATATPSATAATPTLSLLSPTPGTASSATPWVTATSTLGGSTPVPSTLLGPYAVILVESDDVLNIRSAPGAGNAIIGSFPATETHIMRTGPSTSVDSGDAWVEVQNPAGGNGWVRAKFLTEYVPPESFCASSSVNTLIANLDTALTTNNGVMLASQVSPAHGMNVFLWRYGNPVTFHQDDARWVFDSTYMHNWGEAPGSGLVTTGSFHISVLPFLQEVFNASYTLTCDSLGSAPHYGFDPWPLTYSNVNYYTVFKNGTPGVDLDFRFFLVGVEFVNGQPYVFALIHFSWEP